MGLQPPPLEELVVHPRGYWEYWEYRVRMEHVQDICCGGSGQELWSEGNVCLSGRQLQNPLVDPKVKGAVKLKTEALHVWPLSWIQMQMDEESPNFASLDRGLAGRMVLNAELKSTKSSLVWVPCCSRWARTVWRVVVMASFVDLFAL